VLQQFYSPLTPASGFWPHPPTPSPKEKERFVNTNPNCLFFHFNFRVIPGTKELVYLSLSAAAEDRGLGLTHPINTRLRILASSSNSFFQGEGAVRQYKSKLFVLPLQP